MTRSEYLEFHKEINKEVYIIYLEAEKFIRIKQKYKTSYTLN